MFDAIPDGEMSQGERFIVMFERRPALLAILFRISLQVKQVKGISAELE